jgi:hypothetical protein
MSTEEDGLYGTLSVRANVLVGKSQVNEVSVKMREYAWQEFYVLF